MLEVQTLTPERLSDLDDLFGADPSANTCWCMWFVISVKEFHAGGAAANRERFTRQVREASEPLGVIAYDGCTPVGWCAAGPRERFARALRTPTLRGVKPLDDRLTWLVPCFFVHPAHRRSRVTRLMLQHAITLAKDQQALAIEGFPFSNGVRGSSGDRQVGREAVFASCGFTPVHRPSSQRVVMRLDLD